MSPPTTLSSRNEYGPAPQLGVRRHRRVGVGQDLAVDEGEPAPAGQIEKTRAIGDESALSRDNHSIVEPRPACSPAGIARPARPLRLSWCASAATPAGSRYHPPSPDVSADPSPAPGPITRRFVAWTLRHGKLLWALALLLAIPAAWRTATLYRHLRSDIEELLPRDAPSVVAIEELRQPHGRAAVPGRPGRRRQPRPPGRRASGSSTTSPPASARYPHDARSATCAPASPPSAPSSRSTPPPDRRSTISKTIRERIEERLHWEYAQEDGHAARRQRAGARRSTSRDIEKQVRRPSWAAAPWRGPASPAASSGCTLMLIEVGGFSTSAAQVGGAHPAGAAPTCGRWAAPTAYAPGMRVGFTGDVAISAEEIGRAGRGPDALVACWSWWPSCWRIVLFYGWRRSVPALFLPLARRRRSTPSRWPACRRSASPSSTRTRRSWGRSSSATASTSASSSSPATSRRAGRARPSRRRWRWRCGATRKGTLSAALAAGVAYASLVAMQFRGFRQFGVIGGLGMAARLGGDLSCSCRRCWPGSTAGAYRAAARAVQARGLIGGRRARGGARARASSPAARAGRHAGGGLARCARFGRDQLEYDFSRLRRRDTWTSGEGYWGKKMDALLGRYLTPTAILTDSEAEARAVEARLRGGAAPAAAPSMIASIRSYDDVVPPDAAEKAAEVAVIRRKLTANIRAEHDAGRSRQARPADRRVGQPPADDQAFHDSRRRRPRRAHARAARARRLASGAPCWSIPNPASAWWRGETITDVRARAARGGAGAGGAGRAARRASRADRRCRRTSSRRWSATARWRRGWRSRAWSRRCC